MNHGEADRRQDISGVDRGRPRWWLACVRLTTVIGLVCALANWGWQSVAGLSLSLLVIASLAVVAVWGGEDDHDLREIATASGRLTVLLTAAAGLLAATQAWALLVILLLMATSPQADLVRRVRTWLSASESPEDREGAARAQDAPRLETAPASPFNPPVPADLTGLDDAALVLAWRHSFVQLEAARSEQQRLQVVARRQQLLDELERRCPDGVARWLASGARAQSNPQRFLDRDRRQSS
jgi:hypothetical protein